MHQKKKKTTARDDQLVMRNTVKDPRKTGVDLKRDLSGARVNVHSSSEGWLKEKELPECQKSQEKATFNDSYETEKTAVSKET